MCTELQECRWIICFVLAAEKVLLHMRKLLILMVNYGIHNVLCKNINSFLLFFYQISKDHIIYFMNFCILTDVRNASDHSQMESSMSLKDINIVNMIFMFCLHHVAASVVNYFQIFLFKYY